MYVYSRALGGLLAISAAFAPVLVPGTAEAASAVPHLPHTALSRFSGADNSWGGYVVLGSTFKTVTGDWTVPTLDCSVAKGDTSFWSGLDGWTSASTTVEQIGLDTVCTSGGKTEYNPWVEMYPANSIYFTETVKAGDEMTSSVSTSGNGVFTLVLADPTQGWTKTYTKSTTKAKLDSAEDIVEAIGSATIPTNPKFSQVDFTDVTANGEPFADAGSVTETNLERNGVFLTQDSALNGTSFSITWLHK